MRELVKVAAVGLGDVHKFHAEAITKISDVSLRLAYDIDKKKRSSISGVKYVDSLDDLLKFSKINAAIVAVPTRLHYETASILLNAGISVFLEKPATKSMEDLERLHLSAKSNNALLIVSFHDAFGGEVLAFRDKLCCELQEKYGEILSVASDFYDPYCAGGIDYNRMASLDSSWLDSGINALSVIATLFGPLKVINSKFIYPTNRTQNDIAAYVELCSQNLQIPAIKIHTDWRFDKKSKITTIHFKDSAKAIIEHSKRQISVEANGKIEIIWKEKSQTPRLVSQYIRAFQDLLKHLKNRSDNRCFSDPVHHALFDAYQKKYGDDTAYHCIKAHP